MAGRLATLEFHRRSGASFRTPQVTCSPCVQQTDLWAKTIHWERGAGKELKIGLSVRKRVQWDGGPSRPLHQVERALRARFRLLGQRPQFASIARFNFFTAPGWGAEGAAAS